MLLVPEPRVSAAHRLSRYLAGGPVSGWVSVSVGVFARGRLCAQPVVVDGEVGGGNDDSAAATMTTAVAAAMTTTTTAVMTTSTTTTT